MSLYEWLSWSGSRIAPSPMTIERGLKATAAQQQSNKRNVLLFDTGGLLKHELVGGGPTHC